MRTNFFELRTEVLNNVVKPTIESDIKQIIKDRQNWRNISTISEATGHILLGITTILTFSSGVFDLKGLVFASGCVGTICMVLLRFSAYAKNECTERHNLLTRLLKYIDIEPVPSISPDEIIAKQRLNMDLLNNNEMDIEKKNRDDKKKNNNDNVSENVIVDFNNIDINIDNNTTSSNNNDGGIQIRNSPVNLQELANDSV